MSEGLKTSMFTGQSSISPVFPGLEATSDHKTAIFAPAISSAKIITMPAASNTVPASSISGFPWYANLNMPFHFGLDHSTVPICEPDTAIAAKTDLLEPPKSQPEKKALWQPYLQHLENKALWQPFLSLPTTAITSPTTDHTVGPLVPPQIQLPLPPKNWLRDMTVRVDI